MSNTQNKLDPSVIIRRLLFFLVLILLSFGNLFALFRGLNAPEAMDQAQIAREIARGNGFVTKFIRPVAYQETRDHAETTLAFEGLKDTYHAPLNPLINAAVLKLLGADDPDKWVMEEGQMVYPLDRVIATVSTLCFLLAIGASFALISRIFDAKIAGVTALLMLFCETYWNFSLSGLPQMLMLLLFTCAQYFVYRAIEETRADRSSKTPAIIAAAFFSALTLTHYLTIWIAIGYIIFTAIYLKPRGVIALISMAIIGLPLVYIIYRNFTITGTPFGTAFYNLHNGMGGGEELVVRSLDAPGILERGIIMTTVRTFLTQANSIIPFLAGIFVAPLFFLALIHPFRRLEIGDFKWAILLMFGISALGLTFFGIDSEGVDANQTHLLFAPVMTAYGLALVSILWSKLTEVQSIPLLKNAHYIVIIAICSMPLLLSLPQKVKIGLSRKDSGGVPHWPPYFAPALNLGLKAKITPEKIIFSDQPWAVAWYADRTSIWLPPTVQEFQKLESYASSVDAEIAGIMISPVSHTFGTVWEVKNQYQDFTSLVLDGKILQFTAPNNISLYDKDLKTRDIIRRYPYRSSLLGVDMMLYTNEAPAADQR